MKSAIRSRKGRKMKKISRNGRFFFLALDHGLEHGPSDFTETTYNPEHIINLSTKMKITGFIMQKGLAVHYSENFIKKVPLILKLNGKTNMTKTEPFSAPIASVKDAVKLGADAVGYTIYPGSEHEAKMLETAGKIESEARDYGLPLIIWSYPRGKAVKKPDSFESIAYAARVALEIGADITKIHYTGNKLTFSDIIRIAGRCRVITAGGRFKPESDLLKEAKDIMNAGAAGMAVGRNIWQNDDPVGIANALASIIFDMNFQ
ncbi:MAG: fructose-bisphosphate aldolase [Candidatus Micrarchaeota archaeon]|nr:fructose-bisphosphate aldolase [Candidatus Micrarchaeota archaeon]